VPHLNHSIGSLNPTFLAWLDHHLRGGEFPARPVVVGEWTRRGIKLHSNVLPDAKSATFHVAAMTGVGPDFFWMPLAAKRSGRFFVARTPAAFLGARRLMVYAHQCLARGLEQSSFPICLDGSPGPVPASEGGSLPLAPDLWHGSSAVDPLCPFTPLRRREHRGRAYLEESTGSDLNFSFNTRMVALPRWRLRSGTRFRCRLHGALADPVIVAVCQYAGSSRERHFEGRFPRVALAKGIPIRALKDFKGKPPRMGTTLSHLFIGGTTQSPATVRLDGVTMDGG
jgi:hypothetical protein